MYHLCFSLVIFLYVSVSFSTFVIVIIILIGGYRKEKKTYIHNTGYEFLSKTKQDYALNSNSLLPFVLSR